jgi:hypothetical protein
LAGRLDHDISSGSNISHASVSPETSIVVTTQPTPLQAKAFELLALGPACTQ